MLRCPVPEACVGRESPGKTAVEAQKVEGFVFFAGLSLEYVKQHLFEMKRQFLALIADRTGVLIAAMSARSSDTREE